MSGITSQKNPPMGPVTDDPRFSIIHSDPRFAKLKRKDIKVDIDDRFKHMLREKDFVEGPKVDRYGRKIAKNKGGREIKRFYRIEEDAPGYDPARGEGVVDSSEESSDEVDVEIGEAIETRDLVEPYCEEDHIPLGDVTKRFAVVNLDWDNVRAVDLLVVLQSFKPENGKIIRVQICPSEFGKNRMEQEDEHGPPKEIFKDQVEDKDSVDEDEEITAKDIVQEGNDEDYDFEKLRKYQLERLRYYYAVVECDSEKTAKHIYDACDGAEYENSANFLDLRFIPDDTWFSDVQVRDECVSRPRDYSPTQFVTDALQHSKVKLTWDNDEPRRIDIMRKTFSQQELAAMDLRDYLASSDSDSDGIEREASKKRYRELLAPINASEEGNSGGEMEITFTPAFSQQPLSVENTKSSNEETTLDKYKRKEKDRGKRKQERRAERARLSMNEEEKKPEVELGFEDPFFNSEGKRVRTKRKKDSKEHILHEDPQKAELELVMMDENDSAVDKTSHFDMKAILKAEKRKFKRKRGKDITEGLQEDFRINVQDPRFSAVYQDPNYAIDPTNPRFKKTEAMDSILHERRKRMENLQDDLDYPKSKKQQKNEELKKAAQLKNLVNSIKAKSALKKE